MPNMQKFIHSCLLGAADEIEAAKGRGLTITSKARNDKATSADYAAEKFIVDRIRKEYPAASILSEENYTSYDLYADSLFVIDPIDGTHNFIQGLPLYGVSLAHYAKGKPKAGGTYLIPQKQFFYAEGGSGATMNGKRITVSKTAHLEEFFLLCDSRLHLIEEQSLMNGVIRLERMSQHTRFIGSAICEMGFVACGAVDATISFKLKPYDFAAAAFILESAGGKVTDFRGEDWSLETTAFVASNGRQHDRILEVLHKK